VPAGFGASLLQLLFRVDCPTCIAGDQSDIVVSNLEDDLAGIRPCCARLTLADCPTGHGDVNADSTLSAADALCALKIYVNSGNLPPDGSCNVNGDCEAAAADVNCSGEVSPFDALALYERVLCVEDPVPLSCFAVTDPDPCGNGSPRVAAALAFGAVEDTGDGWSVALTSESCPSAFGLEVGLPPGAELVRVEAGDVAAWIALESAETLPGTVRIGGVAEPAGIGRAGTVVRLVLQGGDGGILRVVDAADVAFAGARERELRRAPVPREGLRAVHPNPSSGAVTIEYASAGVHARRELRIHDVTGRLLRRLSPGDGAADPGVVRVAWDGRDDRGRPVAAGIYFVVLRLDESTWTRKVLRVR
jgi:hypothetical protein